jgi:hypothetical protein
MRARYIHEELGFERTGDVKKGLGIGLESQIKKRISSIIADSQFSFDTIEVINKDSFMLHRDVWYKPAFVRDLIEYSLSPEDFKKAAEKVQGNMNFSHTATFDSGEITSTLVVTLDEFPLFKWTEEVYIDAYNEDLPLTKYSEEQLKDLILEMDDAMQMAGHEAQDNGLYEEIAEKYLLK